MNTRKLRAVSDRTLDAALSNHRDVLGALSNWADAHVRLHNDNARVQMARDIALVVTFVLAVLGIIY
jgi:hypothetical protein